MRAAGSDEALRLTPPKNLSLEESLEFLADDELLEVTPNFLRIRKRILDTDLRAKEANRIKNEEGKDFKIIAISGTDNPQIIQEAYKLEIDEFISKAPQWHEQVLKFISNSTNKVTNEEFTRFFINDTICSLTLYKVNNEKYVDKIIKEVNANVLTGKRNVIFNMEHIKIFSDSYANLFSEAYKTISSKDGMLILIKPCEDVIKALEYVFLADAIQIFNTVEEAVEYVEMNNFMF
jgi:hypothetical protein